MDGIHSDVFCLFIPESVAYILISIEMIDDNAIFISTYWVIVSV
jgi:hypothetical protein